MVYNYAEIQHVGLDLNKYTLESEITENERKKIGPEANKISIFEVKTIAIKQKRIIPQLSMQICYYYGPRQQQQQQRHVQHGQLEATSNTNIWVERTNCD